MKKIIFLFAMGLSAITFAQNTQNKRQDSVNNPKNQQNAAQRLLSTNLAQKGLTVGGYAETHYNNVSGKNANLDVHRVVVLFGYKFNDRTQFITELEFEHVKEVYVEQAFLQYSLTDNVNLRAGLMLVPMGIVNEYHEPTTFNGVERPAMDNVIVPTTWREIGFGISGKFNSASLGYQAYVFNGFKSTSSDGAGGLTGVLKGSNGLRGGRQKGIKSTIDSPTFSTKLEYYGLPGLRLGLSGYFGKTQAADDIEDLDGANVGISMLGFDARYAYQRFTARGQFIHASLSDTEDYNVATGRDLGSALQGYYGELAYNLLPTRNEQKLFLFGRYEQYDTHNKTDGSLARNDAYNRTDFTTGLSYHIAPGVVLKGDYQFRDDARSGDGVDDRLNLGIGVWF